MSKRSKGRDIGQEILEGIRQLKRGEVGRVTYFPPIAEVRERVGLSQSEFAKLLGVSVRTLQEWEQGRRVPSGPARALLQIAHKNPKALLELAV
jgi:putative transcriptional regulator